MLRTDWNSLQPGDRVMVHHAADDGSSRLVDGVVTNVVAAGGSNEVTVRLSRRGGTQLVHPGRLTVHHDPIELDGHCWRCSAVED